MANDASVVSISLPAGSDLSAATNLYRFVDIATDGQIDLVGSAGGEAIGVLYSDPAAAGRAAQVAISGVVKITLGGTVTAGMKLQSDASGDAIEAASSDHVLATALTDGVDGDVISALLMSSHILA